MSIRGFFLITLAYSVAAVAVAAASGQDATETVANFAFRLTIFLPPLAGIAAAVCAASLALGHRAFRQEGRLAEVCLAVFAAALFQAAFLAVKTALPDIVPFFADPMLARIDLLVHGGHAPWSAAHILGDIVPAAIVDVIYVLLWGIAATAFPVFLALDPEEERRRTYLILFLAVWIGCGNVLALGVMSAGPVYHDALLGAGDFAGLTAALDRSGLADSQIGSMQAILLEAYVSGRNQVASGISAFPSVHVAAATLLAFYVRDRAPRLTVPAIAFLAAILVLSVYTGYHYAIDGYASILLVALAVRIAKRGHLRPLRQVAHTA